MALSSTVKRMRLIIFLSAGVFIAGGVAYYRSSAAFPFAIGVVLTAGLNVVKVIMLERTVSGVTTKDAADVKRYVRFQYLLRYLLTGITLAFAALAPFVNLWGAIAGIFTLQIAAFAMKRAT